MAHLHFSVLTSLQLLNLNQPSADNSEEDILTPHEVKLLTLHFLEAVLSQLTALQFVLQRPVVEHVYETKVIVQTPIRPPPLADALAQDS